MREDIERLIPHTGAMCLLDAVVAWEAHLAGFAAGVLTVGVFAWAARRLGAETP